VLPVLQRRARLTLAAIAAIAGLTTGAGVAQERDAGGVRAPTAALERGRAVYVLNHCHFCHGVDLTRATMGAANLTQSVLVGADTDGNAIGPVVRAGLPNLQTAMPSYTELTDAEIVDLARYIHYLRQQARYLELVAPASSPAGDVAAGRTFFSDNGNCGSCHSVTGDLAGIGGRLDAATLRRRLLRPGPAMPAEGITVTPGQAAHLRLLEQYTLANVEDLVAYLNSLR
jgi:mono/diheme cytochrome c family protein